MLGVGRSRWQHEEPEMGQVCRACFELLPLLMVDIWQTLYFFALFSFRPTAKHTYEKLNGVWDIVCGSHLGLEAEQHTVRIILSCIRLQGARLRKTLERAQCGGQRTHVCEGSRKARAEASSPSHPTSSALIHMPSRNQ